MFYQYLFKRLYCLCGNRWLFFIAILGAPALASDVNHTQLTRAQWQQDLGALDTVIRQHHINPFWFKSEAGYRRLYKDAHDYIAGARTIDSNRVNGYFEKLVAYLSDGHSYVVNKTARFGLFAYGVEWFGDDLHITSVEPGDESLLGAKVLALDGLSISAANRRIAPYIPVVNSSGFKFHSKDAYRFAGLLKEAGVSKTAHAIELMLELPSGQKLKHVFGLHKSNLEFIDLREPPEVAVPLYRQQPDNFQWLYLMEKERTVYLRYALVKEKNAGDIKRITENLVHMIDDHDVQKLIIDVRDNGGGDSFFNAPLINAISKNTRINQRSKLFVITNHNTFSAAINFTGNMEIKTQAIFVGEKVADRATFVGEVGPQAMHVLPNSGIAVSLSFSEWNTTYDNDQRDAVALDIPVNLSMRDFLAGRDPVVQACLDYSSTKIPAAKSSDYKHWIGRYDYSPDKALKIYDHKGELKLEITELLFSDLYPLAHQQLKAGVSGIELARMSNGSIEIIQSGKRRVLRKLRGNELKPLELLMANQFDMAASAYQKVHEKNPELLSIRGNSLGILASHLRAKYGSSIYFNQLRKIAVSLYGEPVTSWDADE
jgi:hypothetical protein